MGGHRDITLDTMPVITWDNLGVGLLRVFTSRACYRGEVRTTL